MTKDKTPPEKKTTRPVHLDPSEVKPGHYYETRGTGKTVKIERKTDSVNGEDTWWFVIDLFTGRKGILVTDVKKFVKEVPAPSKTPKED